MNQQGIIPLPQGGLGNQIFINIAGYVMSLHLKCPLYLFNNTNCNNSHSTKEYKDNIFKYLKPLRSSWTIPEQTKVILVVFANCFSFFIKKFLFN